MKPLARLPWRWIGLAGTLAVSACVTVPPNAGNNPTDPYERVNRQVFAFNDRFDRAIARPVAKGYVAVVPDPVRHCIGNVFANLYEIPSGINSALQGRPGDVANDAGRFLVNSTVGVLGCFDVAQHLGWERNRQDFGLTMGKWGLTPGPYLVLPFLGPETFRDAIGEIPDGFADPISYISPTRDWAYTYAARFVDRRSQLLDASRMVDEAALDPYEFVRDAYLQRRRSRVYDGAPPPPADEDPDAPDPAPAGGAAAH